jgi:ATP-dependent Clp protease ATP-binding subunit ClpA
MSFFSGHVADFLRLAEDEARMLGQAQVEPEHVLLALCRHGHGRDLLAQRSLQPRDLHAAVVRIDGAGDDLLLGRLPRSRRTQEVLERVVTVAAQRGVA